MNVLHEYTLSSMRQNKKSSLSIMIAILMVTTMMSALCGLLFNIYQDNLHLILNKTGNWHGELFGDTMGSKLNIIESFSSIESVMIKGSWLVAKIDDPRMEYLVFRDANAEYWDSMPEKDSILEGRVPQAPGEIALSKQYFEHHPTLQIGDTILLPLGKRTAADGTPIEPTDYFHDGETFQADSNIELTVVGKLDITTSSVFSAYTGIGYLEKEQIKPDDKLTVYLRFHNIRDTYQELPRIAQAIGYQPDEYGDYELRYNTNYLSRLFIYSQEQLNTAVKLQRLGMPLTYLLTGFLTVAVFVLIIHNVFSLSANARLSQLGIFASIGATPKQIKHSVLFEALILSIIPMPFGLSIGQLLVKLLLDFISAKNISIGEAPAVFMIGTVSIVPSIFLTLVTVWCSAMIPARRIAKMSPISALRQGESNMLKKPRHFFSNYLFGIEGELAQNAVRSRFHSYRTAVISLLLSFFVLFFILCALSSSNASRKIYNTNGFLREESHISLSLYNMRNLSDRIIMNDISSLTGITQAVWTANLKAATWITPDMLSEKFQAAGGYKAAGKLTNTKYLLERDGKFRVPVVLVGLDSSSFQTLCEENNLSFKEFIESENPKGILLNSIEDVTISTMQNPIYIPYLSGQIGDVISCTEKRFDNTEGDYNFSVEIAGVIDSYPPIGQRNLTSPYGIILFLPLSQVDTIAASFSQEGISSIHGSFLTESDSDIKPIRAEIDQICNSWFGSGDYYLNDILDIEENKRISDQVTHLITAFLTGLLGIIGLSNIWSTILGNLNNRKKEFAVLRSVGISPKGILKMLLLEGLILGLTPVLLCIPFCVISLTVLLSINEISFLQWLSYAPLGTIFLYLFCILTAVISAYFFGAKQILKQNIMDAIKKDTI